MRKQEPKLVRVKAVITVETSFVSYPFPQQNEKALEQIECWLAETLNEDEIPLYINTNSEDQCTPKKIEMKLTSTTRNFRPRAKKNVK